MQQGQYSAESAVSTEPSHLAQLRKAKIDGITMHDLVTVREQLTKSEHYVFTAIPDPSDDIQASAVAMKEAGVWRLPYPVCTFEFSAKVTLEHELALGGKPIRMIALLREDAGGAIVCDNVFLRGNKHTWVAVSFFGMDEEGDEENALRLSDKGVVEVVINGTASGDSIPAICSTCLVMLATRGIRRERWIGMKQVLIGRKEPSDAYTRVMVAEASSSQGHGVTSAGERHKVRLHLRCGHTRKQPHGPGRRFTRVIFIEPTLVGYVEEGTVHHNYYEVYPTP